MIKWIKNYFNGWKWFEFLWLGLFTAIIIGLSIYWKDNWMGIVASLTGIWCVVLVAKGRTSNYYFGIVNVIFYALVALKWQYYGEVMLNAIYFLPMQIYGLYFWTRNKNKLVGVKDTVQVKFLKNRGRLFWGALSVIGIIGYGFILKRIGGRMPFTDSTSTVLSIIAMVLMARLFMEQWILWIVVDIVSIALWVNVVVVEGGNDISILIMWVAYLINAVYGMISWIKMHKENQIPMSKRV